MDKVKSTEEVSPHWDGNTPGFKPHTTIPDAKISSKDAWVLYLSISHLLLLSTEDSS